MQIISSILTALASLSLGQLHDLVALGGLAVAWLAVFVVYTIVKGSKRP